MRIKPRVCLIDADPQVQVGWLNSLGQEADLYHYPDEKSLHKLVFEDPHLISTFDCAIVSRFLDKKVDLFDSDLPLILRNRGVGAVFLNWQGYLTKDEILDKFDGRLFNRYGVRWQTLRSRIQKVKSRKTPNIPPKIEKDPIVVQKPAKKSPGTRPQRCAHLLKEMARRAIGSHRDKLQYYAEHDHSSGIELLEAIYNRLLVARESTASCPSRYINSSPIVAKGILHRALFG